MYKRQDFIYEIKISEIIREFINFINKNRHNTLEELSGFIYIISIMLDLKSKSLIPVSYTHLDVYKRQGFRTE